MPHLEVLETEFEGLSVLRRQPIGDDRGYLERMFCDDELAAVLAGRTIRQINQTFTARRGTVRGLHFQKPPYAEMKFVTCLRGEVFDIAVDLRHGSPTFMSWRPEVLSGTNRRTYVIPEGFAHGFQALTDDCVMLYFHTATHHSTSEGGLNVLDSRLAIDWPLPVANLSARDAGHRMTDSKFTGLSL